MQWSRKCVQPESVYGTFTRLIAKNIYLGAMCKLPKKFPIKIDLRIDNNFKVCCITALFKILLPLRVMLKCSRIAALCGT